MKQVVNIHIVQRYNTTMPTGGFAVDLSAFERPGKCFVRATSVILQFSSTQDANSVIYKLVLLNGGNGNSAIMNVNPGDSFSSSLGFVPVATIPQYTEAVAPANSVVLMTDSNSTPITEIDFKQIASNVRFTVIDEKINEVTANLIGIFADLEFTFEE